MKFSRPWLVTAGVIAMVFLGEILVFWRAASAPDPFPDPPPGIMAGIVPHHLVAENLIREFFQTMLQEEPQTVVLLSPDHWGVARHYFTTADTPTFANLAVDFQTEFSIRENLPNDWFGVDSEMLVREHGITGLLPFIEQQAPEAKLLPIAISAVVDEKILDKFVGELNRGLPERAVVIASTDFSHYLPSSAADFHDATSRAVIRSNDQTAFRKLEVDCWQCLYAARSFAALRGAESMNLLGQTNSAKILAVEATADETTSYLGAIFRKGEAQTEPLVTILAVGDLMLGRHVETLRRSRGNGYPFQKIDQFLRGSDVVFGNLEGPINTRHRQTPRGSTRFSFERSVASVLRQHYFNVVSLANNHTMDYGADGFQSSKRFLVEQKIASFGHFSELTSDHVFTTTIRGIPLVFIGFNATRPGFDNEAAIALVGNHAAPDQFVLVSIHWGAEYALTGNRSQQALGRGLIDAGADAIVGQHPHVVQQVEVYHDRPIFYSLGNFIFDQYFSTDTQEGLAVGMEIGEKEARYRLFPLRSRQSQIQLLPQKEISAWLKNLAARSAPDLSERIGTGMLTIPWK